LIFGGAGHWEPMAWMSSLKLILEAMIVQGLQVDCLFICLRIQGILLVKQVLSALVLEIYKSCVAEVMSEHRLATRVPCELEASLA